MQYRYYISQNVLKLKSKPQGLLSRIPAQEIENAVESGVRQQFVSRDRVANLLGLDLIENIETLEIIADLHTSVPFASIASDCIEKIIIKRDVLEIYMKMVQLREVVSKGLGKVLPTGTNDEIKLFQIPYKTARQKSGAIVIKPENAGKDIFDMPLAKLTKFIQGIIWRDEHFGGMTLKDIA